MFVLRVQTGRNTHVNAHAHAHVNEIIEKNYFEMFVYKSMCVLPEGEVRASWGFPVFFESSL